VQKYDYFEIFSNLSDTFMPPSRNFAVEKLAVCVFLRNIADTFKIIIMRQLFVVLLLTTLSMTAFAQRKMADCILAMPDSVVPYLNATKRTEMVDFYGMGVKAETHNLLSESTVLDSLTASYAHIHLSESSSMQLALLPRTMGDTILCVIRTWLGEAPESVVDFYDSKWRKLQRQTFLDEISPEQLLSRPDTMEVEHYDRMVKMIDPLMIQADYSPSEQMIIFSLATPMITKGEKDTLKPIFLQRKVKWNGEKFNNC